MVPAEPAGGSCEVVVYTEDHEASFTSLSPAPLARLAEVWTDRYHDLVARPGIRYVFIFENRGEQVGVTLHHPHGQIYAYPFLPPVAGTELSQQASGCLQCQLIADELEGRRRVLIDEPGVVAYVPGYARWPYEVHVAMREHRAALPELSAQERLTLLVSMQRVTR